MSVHVPAGCRLLLAVAVLSMCAWPREARAQQGWSGEAITVSSPVFTGPAVTGPRLAVDRDGNATAIWAQGEASTAVIQTSRYVAASQSWTPPAVRSLPGEASGPQVAADASGNVVAVWRRFDGAHHRIQAARYLAASDSWTVPLDLSAPEHHANFARVAVDAAGNAIVLWWTELTPTTGAVQTARMTAATGTWSGVRDLISETAIFASIAVACDPAGNAMTVFTLDGSLYWAWYVAPTDNWKGPGRFTSGGGGSPDVAMDAEGTAIAIWNHPSGVTYAARFVPAFESWLLPTIITSSAVVSPKVALNAAGDGQAVWVRTVGTQNVVEAMLYSAASRTWTGPTVLSPEGSAYPAVDVAVDETGNAVAVWSRAYVPPCGYLCLQGARYVAAERMWALSDDLSHPLQAAYNPQVQFDRNGNAITLWRQSAMGYSATQARTWYATPGTPAVTRVGASPGSVTLMFLPPETSEAQFAPVNYAYSIDDGATWITRSPASTASPRVVGGLVDGLPYAVRLRAINSAGDGGASAKVTTIAGPGPDTPTGLVTTSVTGKLVTLEWTPPSTGLVPTGYVVEGGTSPGEVLASLPTGSAAPRFTFAAPAGAFYVRVQAVAEGVRSGPSNEIRLVVDLPAPPSAPAGLLGLVDGGRLALSWTNTFEGGAPTSLWLVVTGAISAVLPLPMGETFTYPDVPAGTYTLAVVAANAAGVSAPSDTVTLAFPGPCGGSPQAPTNVRAWRNGSNVFLTWSPPSSGPAVSRYVAYVGGAYTGSFTTTGRFLSGATGPGTYALSVAAANACGIGAASATQMVVVP
jgi:hypothetical protein